MLRRCPWDYPWSGSPVTTSDCLSCIHASGGPGMSSAEQVELLEPSKDFTGHPAGLECPLMEGRQPLTSTSCCSLTPLAEQRQVIPNTHSQDPELTAGRTLLQNTVRPSQPAETPHPGRRGAHASLGAARPVVLGPGCRHTHTEPSRLSRSPPADTCEVTGKV